MFRELKPIMRRKQGKVLVDSGVQCDFSSNDYLGLAQELKLKNAAIEVIQSYGMGSTGSRLLSGDYFIFHQLEEKVAHFVGKEAALFFNSGYQMNVGVFSALLGREDVVFADKFIHASLIDGIQLSGAKLVRYQHNNMEHLESLLKEKRNQGKQAIIVTESIFSMDGDIAPLNKIVELAESYKCRTYVDEAHAVGVFGDKGAGLVNQYGLTSKVDYIVGTFGKALGGSGAYFACSKEVQHVLVNQCRSFIYSTALPPALVAWNIAALDLLAIEPQRRNKLLDTSQYFRDELNINGIQTPSQSQIVPLLMGENENTVRVSGILKLAGYWALPIRPPTVPEGKARVRFSLTWFHDKQIIDDLIKVIKQCGI